MGEEGCKLKMEYSREGGESQLERVGCFVSFLFVYFILFSHFPFSISHFPFSIFFMIIVSLYV